MEMGSEIEMSNVEDESEYYSAHSDWEDEASQLDEDEVREVNEVDDREINSGGTNSNEVSDEILEIGSIDNREGRNSSEVREISEVDNEGVTMEMLFKDTEVLPWKKQITLRSLVTSFVLSIFFNFIVCKLSLSPGYIPSLNILAGCLGFIIVKFYTVVLDKCGMLKQPFTRQENTVIQTFLIASSAVAFNSGTANYLLAMTPLIASQGDEAIAPINFKHLSIGWMIGFLFAVSFIGLFLSLILKKIMILKYNLTYPSGTLTASIINNFHTPRGAELAKRQFKYIGYSTCVSFVFAIFQWFFANANGCGLSNLPTFGFHAFAERFYFDFSLPSIGAGMICSHKINASLLIGAIISWAIMWPLIEGKRGHWYRANLSSSDLHGIQGYRVFISIAMMLGDSAFLLVFMLIKTVRSLVKEPSLATVPYVANYDENRRREFFLKDQIPIWIGLLGYGILAFISINVLPLIFPQLNCHHLLVAYIIAPLLAFCNVYSCGLTDVSLASNYGKVAILIFSSWIGFHNGGVIAGLASCGAMMTIFNSADLMQDYKTAYLTLTSHSSMLVSQVIGTAVGCIMSPLIFWIFYKTYSVGDPDGSYSAPDGLLYRGIAVLGAEGIDSLPKNCLNLALLFFCIAIAINVLKELLKHYETRYRMHRFVPNAMCIAIPFYLGGFFAIDMCVGSLIVFIWRWWSVNKQRADECLIAVASGLICGDSLWGVPATILSLTHTNAPFCLRFFPGHISHRV